MSDFAKLKKQVSRLIEDGAETSKVLNVVERMLSLKSNDAYTLQCKVVCCMRQEKFGAALSVLDQIQKCSGGSKPTAALAFQRACCLYRMLQYKEALSVLEASSPTYASHIPSRHLLAQLHYNLENYGKAAAVYAALLADPEACHDEQDKIDILTNYTAALVAHDASKAISVVRDEADEKTYDLLYNAATAEIEQGNGEAALKTLRQAEALCAREYGIKDVNTIEKVLALPEEEAVRRFGAPLPGTALSGGNNSDERCFSCEVANTWVQLAYVYYTLLHDVEQAARILHLVLLLKPSSQVITAVASINWVAIKGHSDFFDANRKLKAAQNQKVQSRLTGKQILAIRYNTALLQLSANNLAGCRRVVEQMSKDFPSSELTHSLRLALAVRESKKKRVVSNSTSLPQDAPPAAAAEGGALAQSLADYEQSLSSGRGGGKSAAAVLTRAQIYLENGDLASAVESLTSPAATKALGEVATRPATTATVAAWKVQLGDIQGAVALLKQAAMNSREAQDAKTLLVWAVHYLATSRDLYAEAVDLLKEVCAAVPALAKDSETCALLALCLTYVDLPAAQACIKKLEVSGVAVSAGSSSSPAKMSESVMEQLAKRNPGKATMDRLGYRRVAADGVDKDGRAHHARRRRALRRPAKNMEGRPDPERWLPMAVRSYIKDLPERRKRELKRLRAIEQDQKRRIAADKRKQQAAKAGKASLAAE